MRATTLLNTTLDLPGVWADEVTVAEDTVTVKVRLRRRKLACPECDYTCWSRYDTRPCDSTWRHLDHGTRRVVIAARLRRIDCPTHGIRTEGVAFARHDARFTRDFEDLVAWQAVEMDKDAIAELVRIDWDTVGRICERVVADELDPGRLDDLFEIGVEEISWKKHHNYLTLVVDHDAGKVVWGGEGKDATTLDGFFDELGAVRSRQITGISVDMSKAWPGPIATHAPQAEVCFDPFHVVGLATRAVDTVRRDIWQQLRALDDPSYAKNFKGARWSLLNNPDRLTDRQADKLAAIRRNGGAMWRAYRLKESLRSIFAGDLDDDEADHLLGRWISWAQRCRLEPFVKLQRTIRAHRDGILAAIRRGLNNGRVEGLNRRVRLIVRRAFGFHSAQAALALVMLSCGPIQLRLPHHRPA